MELHGRAKNIGLTPDSRSPLSPQSNDSREIKEVWCYNLDNEMNSIMQAATRYPFIGMDTEFPGICFYSKDKQASFFEYGIIRENVNNLKLIQLGITFCSVDGVIADDCPIWQFNFRFDPSVDVFNAESMQLLEMAGVDFKAHATKGIEPRRFGELITMSGLILSPSITWITFHGIYDFAYFVHILMGSDLPASYEEFDTIRRVYFPHVYDVKALCMECRELSGGLNRIAQQMNVDRVGTAHQSGSDSRVTIETFFRIRKMFFADGIRPQFDGLLYGVPAVKS
ncbi:hypothetical protein JH06_2520 [Blastocystis sp. subtype 4]|uniref:hypothetical protein n=1 Tax=Blastocystis sp. subtype 4 TaxID=944170 RepID=UPI000711BA8A|nr:hypothetical protein JH06_2520 [Blastocystis sp. subtype 4]KNB44659.1 hypothetical protein JH06_2520 [Blastocystis sp. subtype 4]|eukprot:XP_014528096.1 hypothetical protein JH06_2520 [Blastocystis sp. subtype 4]